MSELSREQLSKIFSSNDTNELLALKTHFENCEAPAVVRRTAKYTGHPLYALLTDYMQKCIKEVQDRENLRVSRKKLERLQDKVWRETSTRFSGTATCADGKIVTASTVEKVAELDQSVLEGQNRVSREIEERMYDLNKAQLAAAARAAEIEDYICVQLAGYDARICKKPYDASSEEVDELVKGLDRMTVMAKAVTPCEDDSDNHQVDWLVVDSDGEDCTGSGEVAPLKEDDMIAFLDQMPFADVFETLTAIGSAEASCVTISLHQMLRSITVALEIVRVLAIGVRTYGNQPRYDSFIRRLGRLIAHTVHYVADLFSLYPGRSNPIDPACQEFQRLLRRAVCSLAVLRENAAWQYVLSLPYRLLAFTDTWWLYSGVLADVEGWNERTLLSELVPNDGERHIQMDKLYRRLLERSPKDVFYVCQLIVSLVDARDITRETGIFFVAVKDFFQILLRLDHEDQPVLLEYELNQLMFLLNKHPLLCEAMVDELQWNGQLWIPLAVQLYVLNTVIAAHRHYIPLDPNATPATTANKPLFEAYDKLCWGIVGKLKVHRLDQPQEFMVRVIHEPELALGDVPGLEQVPEIREGVEERRPLAIYAALLATTVGHWVPVFCHTGVKLLADHLCDYSRKLAIRCLQLIVPLFLDCPMSLKENGSFVSLLAKVIGKPPKEARWWSTSSDGEDALTEEDATLRVYCLASRMVYLQLSDHKMYGLPTPAPLVQLWAQVLTALPEWKKCPKVLRMLDVVADVAHHYEPAWDSLRKHLLPHYLDLVEVKSPAGNKNRLFMRSNDEESLYSLKPDLLALSMLSFDLEAERTELELWPGFLQTLAADPAVSVDEALKRVVVGQSTDCVLSGGKLVLYKVARQIISFNHKHPLQVYLWLRFFRIFYTMIPAADGDLPIVHGSTDRLLAYDKQLQDKLKAAALEHRDYYAKLAPTPVLQRSWDSEHAKAAQAQLYQFLAGVVSGIETSIGVLIKFATKQYRPAWDNLRSLQQQYRELLPKRFLVEKQVKHKLTECSMLTKRCTGPVTVSITVSKTVERKEIVEKISQNRSKYNEALKNAIYTPDPVLLALHQANVLLTQLDRWFSDSGALGVHLLPKDHSVKALIGRFVPIMIDHSNLRCPVTEQVLEASFSLFMARVPSLVYDPLLANLHMALIRSDVTILDFLPHVKAAQIPGSHMLQLYSRLLKLNYGRQLEKRAFITVFDEKFDLLQWLKHNSMKQDDLDGMIVETVKALCSTAESSPTTPCKDVPDLSQKFHDTLQRYLLTLVDDNFPEHYETILMKLLNGCEQRQLSPDILLAVNNTVRAQWRVPPITTAINSSPEVRALLSRFTGRQYEASDRFYIYQMVASAIRRLSQYFVTQRTQNCLHGLYPQYRAYVMPLALTFATLGQAYIETFIPSQISSMREAELHVNTVWDTLSQLFSAWLEPYEKTNFASWIQQVGPSSPQELLLQWSDLYVAEASQMLVAFTHCVESIITKLDDSVRIQDRYDSASSVLALVFDWYERNYAHRSVTDTVLTPANVQLVTLPWERFHPGESTLGNFNRILDRFTPIAHQFAAQVFIRCRWDRLTDDLRVGDLLGVCVKLAHEPTVQVNGRSAMMGTLEALSKMRWVGFDPSELKVTLDWFVMSTNDSIILRLTSSPSSITSLDEAILNLLLVASGLRFNEQNPTTEQGNEHQMRKREMFMRCAVRLLLTYVKRNKKALVANPNGSDQFTMAVKGLVELAAHVVVTIRPDPVENSDGRTTVTLLTQLFDAIRVCAAEPTFGYFTQAVRHMLEQDSPGCERLVESVLLGCALYSNRAPFEIMLTTEVALFKHFRLNYQPCDYCSTSLAGSECGGHRDCRSQFGQWLPILDLFNPARYAGWLKSLQETERFSAVPLLLHAVVMSRFITAPNDAERLQTLAQLQTQLAKMNVSTQYESRLYLLWGLMAYGLMTLLATLPEAVTLLQEFVQYLSSVIRGPFGTVNRLVQSALSFYKGTSASPTRRTVAQFLIVCLDFCRQGYYPTGRSASESQSDAVGDDFDMLSDEVSDGIGDDKSPKVRTVTFLRTNIMEMLNDAGGVPSNQKDPTKAAWGQHLESIRSQIEGSTVFAQVVEQSVAPLCVEILSVLGGQDTDILMHTALDGWKKRGFP
ncbi:ectopic P granules protein 5 homolog [Anopheles bellator]|uniref:ectopic P granules protein 5 homolog n=1 Tax=Anopheles bellator TaxID=139047 RepID=UPI0026486DCF|nr:ectopic P granules protein 5 homolog [Anopheles bellator]